MEPQYCGDAQLQPSAGVVVVVGPSVVVVGPTVVDVLVVVVTGAHELAICVQVLLVALQVHLHCPEHGGGVVLVVVVVQGAILLVG